MVNNDSTSWINILYYHNLSTFMRSGIVVDNICFGLKAAGNLK